MWNVTATEPAASGRTWATVRAWNEGVLDMRRERGVFGVLGVAAGAVAGAVAISIGLEIIKGFQAVQAAVKRLTGGGAEMRNFGGVVGATLWAGNGLVGGGVAAP